MNDDEDSEDERTKQKDKKGAATANILEVALQERYRDNIYLNEATFLFNTEYINQTVIDHACSARLLILDYTEQISRDRFELDQFSSLITKCM